MSGATITGTSFSGASLEHAAFEKANLQDTNFSFARLDGVSFKGADLRGASFALADLAPGMADAIAEAGGEAPLPLAPEQLRAIIADHAAWIARQSVVSGKRR